MTTNRYGYQDPAALFLDEVLKTKQLLLKIQKLGVDTSHLEKRIQNISDNIEKEIGKKFEQYESNLNTFLKDGELNNIYNKGIKLLQDIQTYIIEEYNTYSKIEGYYELLETNIKECNSKALASNIENMLKLIKEINTSIPINHRSEQDLIEKIYKLAYQLIKKEFSITGTSKILHDLKKYNFPLSYLENCIIQEINSLDKNNYQNKPILNRVHEIESKGLESSYLDETLIQLLSLPRDKEAYQETKEHLISIEKNSLDTDNELCELKQKRNSIWNDLKNLKDNTLSSLKELLLPASILTIYTTSYIGLGIGLILGVNRISKDKVYPTTEETYDVTNNKTLVAKTYNTSLINDTVQLITYNPWEKGEYYYKGQYSEMFGRQILTYDLSEIDYADLSDYTELDLTALGITGNPTTEKKSTLTPEDLYEEAYTLIKRYTQDKENAILERTDSLFIETVVDISVITILTLLYLFIYMPIDKNNLGFNMLIKRIENLLYYRKNLKNEKYNLTENEKEIEELMKQREELFQILEQEYNQLPDFMKQDEELSSILKRVRKPQK